MTTKPGRPTALGFLFDFNPVWRMILRRVGDDHAASGCNLHQHCLFASHAFAQSRVDEAVRLSKLTLSAMECANLAPNETDGQRLFEVGLSSGRKFLDLLPKLSPEEVKAALPNLAKLWRGTSGPSTDFALGRVFEQMTTIAYK